MKHAKWKICATAAFGLLMGNSHFSVNAATVEPISQPIIVAATKAQCKSQAKACKRDCKKRFKTSRQRMSCGSGCRSKKKSCESKASG